jgi:predicted RNase H-like nuclease (RuvC/YqgF family)
MDDKITVSTSFIEDLTEQINTLKVQIRDEQMQSKFWEDNHAKLEEKLRTQYDAEFEAFKVSFENRIRDEYEQKLNEAAHADASEITSLRKELEEYKISLGKMTNLMIDRDALIKQLQDNAYEAANTIDEAKDLFNRWVFTGSLHDASLQNETVKWVQEVEKKIICE